ncbi:hypothetical protein D9M68_349890 [compost metagenome]
MRRFEDDGAATRERRIGRRYRTTLHVADEDRLARTVDDRVVRPRRQLVVARIAAPGEGRAFRRNVEAELLVGDDVDPGLRRRFAATKTHDILATAFGKTTEAVPEGKAIALDLGRGNVCLLLRRRQKRSHELAALLDTFHRCRRIERVGAGDLVGDRAVAGMEHGARGRQQGRPGLRFHQVAAHREDMLARAVRKAAKPQVLAHGIQRMLHILRIGRGPLVDDDEVGGDAAGAHIFLGAQRFTCDAEIAVVVDAEAEDRVIARDRQRPELRLGVEACLHRRRVGTQMHVRIDEVAAEHLEARGLLRCHADMAHLHLAAGPGVDEFLVEGLRMAIAVDRAIDLLAARRSDCPEDDADLLAGGHANDAAQRHDRIERKAVRARKHCVRVERGSFGKRPARADEAATVGLRFRMAIAAGIVGDEMRHFHVRVAGAALVAADANDVAAAADFRAHEHLRKGRVGAVGLVDRKHRLGIGGHFDEAILGAGVEQDDPAPFGVVFGGDDALDLAGEVADGLDEFGLVVAEAGQHLLAGRTARLRCRGPPIAGRRVAQEDEGAGAVLDRIRLPAGDGLAVPAGIAGAVGRQHD